MFQNRHAEFLVVLVGFRPAASPIRISGRVFKPFPPESWHN
ncbi:hypothetical protein N875_10715 [Neisseria meningitidis LNP21362]|nr:hypothetical protein N875_10715 [Neisseria meningitidis LNP21362]